MQKRDIYVVGYPRSGNTYLSRLLGDLLDSPVKGKYAAHPLAQEGMNRPGDYTIRQLHLKVSYDNTLANLVPDPWTFAVRCWTPGDLVVTIVRDPRDVAVSAWKYWEIDSLASTIRYMGESLEPLKAFGPWQKFVQDWLCVPIYLSAVRYENLVQSPLMTLKFILLQLGITPPSDERIQETIDRQAIDARRKEIAAAPEDKYMYGKTIQLKHLRKGIVGDWGNWFTQKEGQLAEKYFGELMRKLKYTSDENWWKGLRE